MDLTGLKFVSDKKQSNIDQYRFASSILQPTKMIDFPFVRLTGNVDYDDNSPARTYSSNPNNGPTLLSQAKTFKTDMVGGFVGSKSHGSTANRDTHQIWDVVIGKLNDFVQSKLVEKCAHQDTNVTADKWTQRYHELPSLPHNFLSSLFQDSSSPIASFILATNANCYLQKPTSGHTSSPLPSPAVQPPTPLPTHPIHINISEHLSPHISSPLVIPDHCTLRNITSFPITLSKPLTPNVPTELLYKNVNSIQQQPPPCKEPIVEQKSYAEVAKMAGGKCGPKMDQRCPKPPRNHASKRHQLGNPPCQRLAGGKRSNGPSERTVDGNNWRDHNSATAKDLRRSAYRTPHKNNRSEDSERLPFHTIGDRTAFHPVYSRDGLRSRSSPSVPFDDKSTFPPRNTSRPLSGPRNTTVHGEGQMGTTDDGLWVNHYASDDGMRVSSRSKHRANEKPRIVHEKHPNYEKNAWRCCEPDAASCQYYDVDERRCINWRCRHDAPSKSSPRRHRSFTRVRSRPNRVYSPPNQRHTIKNTVDKYLRTPCDRIAAYVSRPVLPSARGNLSKLNAAVEKCAEAFCAAARSRGVDDVAAKNLSRVADDVKKRHDETTSRDRTSEGSATKRRTMSEDSEDSFVVFGVGDVEGDDDSDAWSDEDSGDDSDETDDDDSEYEAMSCVTLEMDEMSVSPRMKDVNERWQAEVERGGARSEGTKKVKFAPPSCLAQVHAMVLWDFAYRSARCGPWEQMARDRERFRLRILRSEPTLAAVLTPAHRDKMRPYLAQ